MAALNELQERLKKSAAPSTVAPAPASPTNQPGPKEMEDALCAPADKPNKYGMKEADCRIQVAQCVFEVSKLGPLSNFDPIVACMDKKFLKAASARALFV